MEARGHNSLPTPWAFPLSLHPEEPGSPVPPNKRATLLSLAPELGVAEIGQDLPKLQERMLNGSPGGWWRKGRPTMGNRGKEDTGPELFNFGPPGPSKPHTEASPEDDMEARGLRAACTVSRRGVSTNSECPRNHPQRPAF